MVPIIFTIVLVGFFAIGFWWGRDFPEPYIVREYTDKIDRLEQRNQFLDLRFDDLDEKHEDLVEQLLSKGYCYLSPTDDEYQYRVRSHSEFFKLYSEVFLDDESEEDDD